MMVFWRANFRRRVIIGLLTVALVATSLFVVPLSGEAKDVGSSSIIYADSGDTISFDVKRVETGSGSSASVYYMLTDVNVHVATDATKADEILSVTISYPNTMSVDTTAVAAISDAVFSRWQLQNTVTDSISGNKVSNYVMPTPISSAQAALALSNLHFVSDGSRADTGSIAVTYSANIQDTLISWIETGPNGDRLKHFYQRVDSAKALLWQEAYNAALTQTYRGLNGYLCTTVYEEEGNVVASLTSTNGWFAATRYRCNDSNKTKIGKDPVTGSSRVSAPSKASDYFTGGLTAGLDNVPGNNWYWCAGPSWENGRQFYAVGKFGGVRDAEDPEHYHDEDGKAMWNNWYRGIEPGNHNRGEGVMEWFVGTKWNDLNGIIIHDDIKTYYIEYSEGWASEGGGTYTLPSTTFRAALPAPKETQPTAKPAKEKKYNISFSPNWGKLKIKKSYKSAWKSKFKPRPAKRTVTYGKTYGKLPAIKKNPKGYKFAGWYTAASGGKRITAKSKVTIKKSTKLYAHWKKLKLQKYGKVVNTGALYTRSKPSLHVNLNPVVGILKKGQTFKIRAVIGKNSANRWYKLTYKGKTAYAFAKYVKVIYK